jgi:hypothetical protein
MITRALDAGTPVGWVAMRTGHPLLDIMQMGLVRIGHAALAGRVG